MTTTTDIGRTAESAALKYLQSQGLKLVESNYRCRHGEIDIIMMDKQTVVFVEVRYRSNPNYGTGAESVDSRKQQKLLASASHYLQKNKLTTNQSCRFDVISLTGNDNNKLDTKNIQWIRNAIEA